jgi:hypothetical protein
MLDLLVFSALSFLHAQLYALSLYTSAGKAACLACKFCGPWSKLQWQTGIFSVWWSWVSLQALYSSVRWLLVCEWTEFKREMQISTTAK